MFWVGGGKQTFFVGEWEWVVVDGGIFLVRGS